MGHIDQHWNEVVSLLGAPPDALPDLMAGLIACHQRVSAEGSLPPVVHAACIGFLMVYIHPFMDGNGRAHHFLLHNVLAQREYAPPGTLFPLSAWMLNHRWDYIGCMTDTCQGILGTANLQRLPDGRLKVLNDIKSGFQFQDLTLEALSLCRFVEASVREELEPNIEFLKHFDEALHGLEGLVEWPYPRLALFIKLCVQNNGSVQNNGRLSKRKRNLESFPSSVRTATGSIGELRAIRLRFADGSNWTEQTPCFHGVPVAATPHMVTVP